MSVKHQQQSTGFPPYNIQKVEDFKSPTVIMSIDYHFAPEYPFPFAIIDGQSAISFLAERVVRV